MLFLEARRLGILLIWIAQDLALSGNCIRYEIPKIIGTLAFGTDTIGGEWL